MQVSSALADACGCQVAADAIDDAIDALQADPGSASAGAVAPTAGSGMSGTGPDWPIIGERDPAKAA